MRISAIANVSGPWAAFAVGVVAAVSPIGPSGMGLAGQSVAGLPHADSKTFLTLEAYLQHLKSLAPIDVPHYLARFIHPTFGGRSIDGDEVVGLA